ncbi:MAG: histidine phosphatase family protein [Hyphomonadaceae bacterium]
MTTSAPGETLERAETPLAAGAIILARHGRPDCDRSVRIDWRGYAQWWADYERAGLAAGQVAPEKLHVAARAADVLFASPAPRAVETAAAVADGRPILQDAVFVEAPLPPPRLWGRHTPRAWGVFARIAWWLGRHDGQESRQAAELRAEAAVATLAARALRGESVALMAHGWFNRMMRRVLKRQGWRETYDGGDSYWSFRRFERKQ